MGDAGAPGYLVASDELGRVSGHRAGGGDIGSDGHHLPAREGRPVLSIKDHLSDRGIDKWIAELGCTNAPVPRRNVRTALSFFAGHMSTLPVRDALGFVAAMDLSKPVTRLALAAGERLMGFRLDNESPFRTFFVRRGASMHNVGVNTTGRAVIHFVVRVPVDALESFTTGAKDTWTRTWNENGQKVLRQGPGQFASISPWQRKWFGDPSTFGVIVAGGGRQLILPESASTILFEAPSETLARGV